MKVFEDEFNGKFNGVNITDAINTRGQAVADGLDDRIWHLLPYSQSDTRTDPRAISVNQTAGELSLRAFSEGVGNHKFPGMLATGSNGSDRTLRFEATYGYVETRMKIGDRPGVGSDFFMFSRDLTSDSGKPLRDQAAAGTEIDIFEHTESETGVTQNLHWDGYTDMHESTGSGLKDCPHVTTCVDAFHTYGMLWDPTGYRFFIDGHETHAIAGPVSHHPLYMVMSQGVRAWTAGNAASLDFGAVGAATNPVTVVDYVKIWQPAVSNMTDRSTPRNVPVAIPFTISSLATGAGNVPAPRVTSLETKSSVPTAIHSIEDLKITGTGADRTLLVRTGRSTTFTGPVKITVTAKNGLATVGSDIFWLTLGAPAADPPALTALPDQVMTTTSGPTALAFTTSLSNPTWDPPSSTNDYLIPDASLALSGNTGSTRALSLPPLPDRTGTTSVTVTARSGSNSESKTFLVTVGLPALANGGFETGLPPWQLGGSGAVGAGAKHNGAQGMHIGIGAVTQRITVAPNTTYSLSAWGRTSGAGGVFDMGVLDAVRDDPENDGVVVDDGDQRRQVRFDSTTWTEKRVTFRTGRFTHAVDVFANNFTVSEIGFDVDDVTLGYGPEIQHLANQSIGHATCVRPPFNVGRVGNETEGWTVSAAVTAGDPSLLQAGGLTVETANTENWPSGTNLFRKALKITPQTAQTSSGQLTVTLTATDTAGRTSTEDITVWVNAGSFRNGSFETEPNRDTSAWMAPGCSPNPAAWTYDAGSTGISWQDRVGRVWNDYPNKALVIGTGTVSQVVTGLEPGTVYELSGDVAPDKSGTGTRFTGFLAGGPGVTAANGSALSFARTEAGWERGTVQFTTDATGQATIQLYAYGDMGGQFHDIALVKKLP